MLSLSPAKLLVILVIALIVLGPEKLPQVARQIGAAWHDLRQWRSRIESEVRGAFPDLPPTNDVANIVRSPLAFLDRLADEHEKAMSDQPAAAEASEAVGPGPPGDGAMTPAGESDPGAASSTNGSVASNGSVGHNGSGAGVSSPVGPDEAPVERSGAAAPGAAASGAFPAAPDDPSMN
jgi:sec-independent protein translocase protein TatB